MSVISLCDVVIRRRASLPSPVADPAASLPQVELAEADPLKASSTSRTNSSRYTREIRQVAVPPASPRQVEWAVADPGDARNNSNTRKSDKTRNTDKERPSRSEVTR